MDKHRQVSSERERQLSSENQKLEELISRHKFNSRQCTFSFDINPGPGVEPPLDQTSNCIPKVFQSCDSVTEPSTQIRQSPRISSHESLPSRASSDPLSKPTGSNGRVSMQEGDREADERSDKTAGEWDDKNFKAQSVDRPPALERGPDYFIPVNFPERQDTCPARHHNASNYRHPFAMDDEEGSGYTPPPSHFRKRKRLQTPEAMEDSDAAFPVLGAIYDNSKDRYKYVAQKSLPIEVKRAIDQIQIAWCRGKGRERVGILPEPANDCLWQQLRDKTSVFRPGAQKFACDECVSSRRPCLWVYSHRRQDAPSGNWVFIRPTPPDMRFGVNSISSKFWIN